MLKRFFNRIASLFRGDDEVLELSAPDAPFALTVPTNGFCIIVNARPGDRAAMLSVLGASNMAFCEVAEPAALQAAMAQRSPTIVICSFDAVAQLAELSGVLRAMDFKGVVQPVAATAAAAESLRRNPLQSGSGRVKPALVTPLRRQDLEAAFDVEGLSRTAEGAVSVSLRSALKNGWVEFWYQPKIDFASKTLVGVETLARVRHPEHGILLPGSFLRDASADELQMLGLTSIRTAMTDWPIFNELRFNLLFSVNTPMSTFEAPGLADFIRSNRPADPRWPGLLLEIEAAEIVARARQFDDVARRVSSEKIKLCIDNFGLAGGSPEHLSGIDIKEIKIHQNLVRGASTSDVRGAACRAAIEAARRYEATVVAAGIETNADFSFARTAGCDVGQGKLMSEPLNRELFIDLLNQRIAKRARDRLSA